MSRSCVAQRYAEVRKGIVKGKRKAKPDYPVNCVRRGRFLRCTIIPSNATPPTPIIPHVEGSGTGVTPKRNSVSKADPGISVVRAKSKVRDCWPPVSVRLNGLSLKKVWAEAKVRNVSLRSVVLPSNIVNCNELNPPAVAEDSSIPSSNGPDARELKFKTALLV